MTLSVHLERGSLPLILSFPHSGVFVPAEIEGNLNSTGLRLADTDWHVPKLYDGLMPGASRLRAHFHRYVVDANRSPSDETLYSNQNTTGLCPLTDFTGTDIYLPQRRPDARETERRLKEWYWPFHNALSDEIERVHKIHGVVVLVDCHSIQSRLPYLFPGCLPDINIGTNSGKSCDADLEAGITSLCADTDFTLAVNERFKGGWITRHYGQPQSGVHAVQIELVQANYMQEAPPWRYLPEKAESLRAVLSEVLRFALHFAQERSNLGKSR